MERIYVTVRARPLSPEDSKSSPWRISGNSISLAGQSNSKFDFDRIFGEDCKTDDVYEARTKEIVASAVRGFNGTVFAYGQTNSGKTHTMRGSVAEPGIIPLAVYDLFQSIQEDMDREFLVRMSYMEIYNEEINDLLVPEHRRLQIHESHERGIYVAGLREEIVTSPEQVIDFMEFGESHRHIGETNMNLYSSRSHTIFRMIIESRERTRDGDDNNSCEAVRVSVLVCDNLVDLAGSERAAKTGAEGLRLKEGSHINKSLMTLGTVIKKLSEGADIQGGHVPYRDSKLTRILQPALGGNANTAIICNITLAQVHVDETKSSLQFASRALCVTNCACVNEILTDAALLKRQRKEIEELRGKLLASHSEHWEEEILNLRNTLLQSELEKERIALELEEEKRAKAQRERRLIEQAKKIENLSSLVLCSERDEKSSFISKNKRRVTWCPGPLTQKLVNEVSSPDQGAAIKMSNKDGRGVGLPPPFEELIQSSGVSGEDYHSHSYLPDGHYADKLDFPLPDAHALLHITRRRKIHSKGVCLLVESDQTTENHVGFEDQTMKSQFQTEAMEVETGCLTNKSMEIEYTPCRASTSVCEQSESASCENKGFGSRESEAVLVIKQLQDQIRSLELEKNSIQSEFESAVKLVADQNGSFRDNYEEVLRLDSSSKLSMQIEGVALEFDHLRETIGNISSTMECFSQNFPALSEMLLELKSFAFQDMEQFKFIISSHNKMHGFLKRKIEELQLEKSLSHDQSIDHHQQIEKLEADLVDQEKASADRIFQYELEKDDLLSQILNLQKEVSCLSTSSLAREKETLRKELDKTKVKLRDTEAKFKSTIQEKIKLESEKAQAEREIKHLHSQKAILERDIWKRDSIIDKQRELKFGDLNKPKGSTLINEQTLKDEYQKLEILACEMEAEIASLKEAWVAAKEEKQEAVCRIEILGSELEAMAYKLKSTNSEMELLQEEIASMKKKLDESESLSKKFEASLQSLSGEKEEMAMQLTDALLEMEAEKSSWSIKERAYSESNERLKMPDDEIVKLSKELLEVRIQLDSCREQCSVLTEKLSLSERTEQEEHSMTLSSGILDLRNEMGQYLSDRVECAELRSNFEKLSSEYHYACGEINYLKDKLSILARERDLLSLKLKEMDARSKFSDDYQNLERQCLVISRERDDLLSRTLDLETALAEAEGTRKNYDDMLLEARRSMMESTTKLSTLESRMHEKGVKNNKENTKLKMQLRWTQAKLDMFRQRYQEAENEKGLMNRKFEEAASKLKEQLGSYGVEILRLKKQLATKQ